MDGFQQRSQFFWMVESPVDVESREAWAGFHQEVVTLRTHSVMMEVRMRRISQC